MLAILFLTLSLFTVIYNVATVVTILRNRVEPYFKIKFSLVLNTIMCSAVGYLWYCNGHLETYDFTWMLLYLLLMIWYAIILARRKK